MKKLFTFLLTFFTLVLFAQQPKVLKVTLRQEGHSAPVPIILRNDFRSITFKYISPGSYQVYSQYGEFTQGKTIVTLPFAVEASAAFGTFNYTYNSPNSIGIGSFSDVQQLFLVDGLLGAVTLNGTPFTIEVWP